MLTTSTMTIQDADRLEDQIFDTFCLCEELWKPLPEDDPAFLPMDKLKDKLFEAHALACALDAAIRNQGKQDKPSPCPAVLSIVEEMEGIAGKMRQDEAAGDTTLAVPATGNDQ